MKCYTFKGFKRAGNHLIIFNLINNILGGNNDLKDLKSIGTWVFYNHEKKIVFFNCFDAYLDMYKKLISVSLLNDKLYKNEIVKYVSDILVEHNSDFEIINVIDFLSSKIDKSYRIFFSIEDLIFENEVKLLNDIFGNTEYSNETFYINRDIENLYSSRKKTNWMPIGFNFVKDYYWYLYLYESSDNLIKFENYVSDSDYRSRIHVKFNINKNALLDRNYILPVGNSSFDDSSGIFNRTEILDDDDFDIIDSEKKNFKKYTEHMKIHLGCAEKHIDDFINVDVRELPGVDVIDDITKLNTFKNNSAELIYASHVLEHTGRREYMNVLKRWYDILKPGGTLRIAVPDFEKVVEHYNENHDLQVLRGFLYGGQTYAQNYHYCAWDFDTLANDLKALGFKEVNRYDWRETEHSHIDDFSQCYLPHMDKENGKLMSLNVEAIK